MSCMNLCFSCVLCVFYSLLLTASATLVYIGSRTLILANQYQSVAQNTQIIISSVCILCAGLLLFLVTIIGIVAFCKRSRILLVVFYSLLMVVLFCEIGAVLISVFRWPELESKVKEVLRMELDAYSKDSDSRFKVDYIQSSLQCCGIDGFLDWNATEYFRENHDYPSSCCPPNAYIMQLNGKSSLSNTTTAVPTCTPYPTGCKTALSEKFHAKLTLIIAVGVVFLLLQVLSLHGSCILICHSQPTVVQRFQEQEYARI